MGAVSSWHPTSAAGSRPPTAGICIDRRQMRSRRRPPLSSSWARAGLWEAPPLFSLSSSPSPSMGVSSEDECRPQARARKRARSSLKRWAAGMLTRVTAGVAAAEGAGAAPQQKNQQQQSLRGTAAAKNLGVLLLPPLGWFPATVAGVLRRRPVECAAASASAAEPVVAAGRSMWNVGGSGFSVLKVRLIVSCVCILFSFLVHTLRFWAKQRALAALRLHCSVQYDKVRVYIRRTWTFCSPPCTDV